jgi:hypothetical protein
MGQTQATQYFICIGQCFTTFNEVHKVHNSVTSVKVQFKGEAVLTGHIHNVHKSEISAIVTPQNANHYSLAQVQVTKLQTFSVQQMGISMQ